MNKLNAALMVYDEPIKLLLQEQLSIFSSIRMNANYSNFAELLDKIMVGKPDILFVQADSEIEYNIILKITPLPCFTVLITDKNAFNIDLLHRGFFEVMDKNFSADTLLMIMSKIMRFYYRFHPINDPIKELAKEAETPYLIEKEPPKDYMFINSQKKKIRIVFEEILYAAKVGSAVKLIMKKSDPIYHNTTLCHFLQRLPPDIFIRINASTILNIKQVGEFAKNKVIVNGESFPITRQYLKNFQRAIE
ncbi:MAG: LytTR family transcriptional regulator DNA-binding domain-containing protein [Bacteroidales bacterium]|jgi:DNA-binding LytR/AlgR family response regulator|nr:LytTR family transcriptional regulator DNA-binding domain-containing protein [Bacteroidales bacterium]